MIHEGMYPAKTERFNTREPLYKIVDKCGIDLVLQGHDHFREELTHRNVNYTVLGAIADKSESPEYLRIEVTSEGMKLDWHIIS